MSTSLMHTSDAEAIEYYMECHSPLQACKEPSDNWIDRMLDLLGPDDCKFIIRSVMPHLKGMWMSDGNHLWVPNIAQAVRYSWGQTAAKCTNHCKLEAVRIINENEAIDSKGVTIKLKKFQSIEDLFVEEDLDQDLSKQNAENEGLPPVDDHGPYEVPQIDTAAAPIPIPEHLIELDADTGVPLNPHLIGPIAPFGGEF